MEDKKKLIIITSIIAVGIPLFAISTQTILKKARDDYYKIQKQQIEDEKAKERAEKEQRLAQEKAEREKQIQQEKEEKEKRITEERNERRQKAAEQKLQREQTAQDRQNKREKVKITNAAPVFTPEPEVTTTEKHELTPEEVRKAKNALKEARASYFSGNKAAKPSKTSKNTDKIIIKSDSKGNVEAIRHTKEENAKAQRILKEIRDSYYKNSKR
ncbi:hypothetical protein HMPREF3180_00660 [Leptotrichia wadei]|jgi:hypothetical protein|uniref:Uncharacterized protein n=1 Tax=Leptotrichia wadei TaxID=157687 RepID=A0A134AM87_9FUSO|nr:hypothetical protein [Leptotrichia wadei]KXB68815.1 hypothetical protein HMPREF3180_00660 [Leptotrichia wadei]BBM49762.1 hypothetical protein JMUB3934_1058 [Leptotrichia wadei]